MSMYFNAFIMLAATILAFVLLARLFQAMRLRRFGFGWSGVSLSRSPLMPSRLTIEQTCAVDGKRRLLLVQCDDQHVLLMIGGPADLVISVLPSTPKSGINS